MAEAGSGSWGTAARARRSARSSTGATTPAGRASGRPVCAGEAVLTDVVANGADEAWAVGYQNEGGTTAPLVLRWDGRSWSQAEAPDFDSPEVVLTAVTAPPTGGIWVVGAAWDSALSSHEAVAAWWDGQAWNEVAGPEGGTELHDVVGSLDTNGWAVGRSGLRSSVARVCLPAQSGIFGGSEPSPEPPPADELASGDTGEATGALTGGGHQCPSRDGSRSHARRGGLRGCHHDAERPPREPGPGAGTGQGSAGAPARDDRAADRPAGRSARGTRHGTGGRHR